MAQIGSQIDRNAADFAANAERMRALVTDLVPGRWHARYEGGGEVVDLQVPEDSGAAWLEGQAGDWTLFR